MSILFNFPFENLDISPISILISEFFNNEEFKQDKNIRTFINNIIDEKHNKIVEYKKLNIKMPKIERKLVMLEGEVDFEIYNTNLNLNFLDDNENNLIKEYEEGVSWLFTNYNNNILQNWDNPITNEYVHYNSAFFNKRKRTTEKSLYNDLKEIISMGVNINLILINFIIEFVPILTKPDTNNYFSVITKDNQVWYIYYYNSYTISYFIDNRLDIRMSDIFYESYNISDYIINVDDLKIDDSILNQFILKYICTILYQNFLYNNYLSINDNMINIDSQSISVIDELLQDESIIKIPKRIFITQILNKEINKIKKFPEDILELDRNFDKLNNPLFNKDIKNEYMNLVYDLLYNVNVIFKNFSLKSFNINSYHIDPCDTIKEFI